jgi:cold shock protein
MRRGAPVFRQTTGCHFSTIGIGRAETPLCLTAIWRQYPLPYLSPAMRPPVSRRITEEVAMLSGRVKWFDAVKGYGFIIPDNGGRDLFVHITAVQQAGYTSLVPGTRLSYEIRPDREGNPTAESLKIGYRPE